MTVIFSSVLTGNLFLGSGTGGLMSPIGGLIG
jgi:hypothetical protein